MGEPAPNTELVREMFARANFVGDLGIELTAVGAGTCDARLVVQARHAQQDGFAHAGVIATLADHTAGGAAGSLLRAGQRVLSIEFKVNLLRPAAGRVLRCHASVLRQGRTISVTESEVFAGDEANEKLVAKATVTLAVLEG